MRHIPTLEYTSPALAQHSNSFRSENLQGTFWSTPSFLGGDGVENSRELLGVELDL